MGQGLRQTVCLGFFNLDMNHPSIKKSSLAILFYDMRYILLASQSQTTCFDHCVLATSVSFGQTSEKARDTFTVSGKFFTAVVEDGDSQQLQTFRVIASAIELFYLTALLKLISDMLCTVAYKGE